MSSYSTNNIFKMDELDHVRNNTGMYIGSTETATRLLEEALDNALDEVQAGYCDKITIGIDTKENTFLVADNGRGFPFDQSIDIDQDPPVLTATKLFTSGKFKKGEDGSAYKISSGLHGIGNTAINSLSDWMTIVIYRDGKFAEYQFKDSTKITRTQNEFDTSNRPYSTCISAKPSKEFFESTAVDQNVISERVRIACANYPNLTVDIKIDDKVFRVTGDEQTLILNYLSENVKWERFHLEKEIEQCDLTIAWDEEKPISPKLMSCVNLVRVHNGKHVIYLYNSLKNVFKSLGKKYKYNFESEDCLIGLRAYLNLKIIKTSFEAQVKVKLESKSDITVMDPLESQLKKFFESNIELRTQLLERFQSYRMSIQSKKTNSIISNGKKRVSASFTKLSDCTKPGGELIIGEGDSAINGLAHIRDKRKHATLPLRGVIPNSLTKKDLLNNKEVNEIKNAIGTGIGDDFDLSKCRYKKIIIATDADAAGHHISCLLIILFAKLMPQLIKEGMVYLCETPLFGVGNGDSFEPLWNNEDIERARNENKKVDRYKGLGTYMSSELKRFILDENRRKLVQVTWSKDVNKLFKLMTDSSEKRKLFLGGWK